MSESKRTRNTNSVLSVGQALDRIRERLKTQPEREMAHARAFLQDEAAWHAKVAARVPEDQRASLAAMLRAVGATAEVVAGKEIDAEVNPDSVPERLRHEFPPERLAVGRGR